MIGQAITSVRLAACFEGDLYGVDCSTVYRGESVETLDPIGSLPPMRESQDSWRRQIQTACPTRRILVALFGRYPTVNLWPTTDREWYASRGRHVYRTDDAGNRWSHILSLPESSGTMGVLPSGFCFAEGAIYLGEYPLDDACSPRVLRSDNRGRTWTTVCSPDARHIHAVQRDPFTNDVWISTGDADEECRIGRLESGSLEVVGTGSQQWRAVQLVFTPTAVLWGMDCPYRPRNHIFRLNREDISSCGVSPTPVHTLGSPVYYGTSLETNSGWTVAFSSAIEPATEPRHEATVVHASSADDFETWKGVETYKQNSAPLKRLLPTNSYVFLDGYNGALYINPYNTDNSDGKILKYSL